MLLLSQEEFSKGNAKLKTNLNVPIPLPQDIPFATEKPLRNKAAKLDISFQHGILF